MTNNRELSTRFIEEVINGRKLSVIDETVAEDFHVSWRIDHKISNGKLVETRMVRDNFGLMRQLGVIPEAQDAFQ